MWERKQLDTQPLGERLVLQHQSSWPEESVWQIRKGRLLLKRRSVCLSQADVPCDTGLCWINVVSQRVAWLLFCNVTLQVFSAKVVTNARSPGAKCYGLVTMSSSAEVARCISHIDRTELHGQQISVDRVTWHRSYVVWTPVLEFQNLRLPDYIKT